MDRKIGQIISYAFHPLLMPTFTFCLLYVFAPYLIQPISWMSLPFLFITTFIVPLISVSILKVSGSITSLKMENRDERLIPFVFITLFFIMTSYLFVYKIGVNELVEVLFFSTTLLLVVLTVITTVFKISIHAAGMTGVVGYLLALCIQYPGSQLVYPLILTIILSGAVMTARLKLNAHQPVEILAGFVLGLVICFSALFWFV